MSDGRWRNTTSPAQGAVAGVAGVVTVLPVFYPLGRLFDPTVGGDMPVGLLTELVLGFIGGLVLSPLGALVGGVIGLRLEGRRLGVAHSIAAVGVATGFVIVLFAALNASAGDGIGSFGHLLFVGVLGVLAGTVAAICNAAMSPAFVTRVIHEVEVTLRPARRGS